MDNRLRARSSEQTRALQRGGLGLWLPPSPINHLSPELRSGPVLRWACRQSDQPGVTISATDFWDRMQTVDPIAAVRALAGVNIGLEIDHLERRVQHGATERHVRPQHRSLSAPGEKHSTEGDFFAHTGVLVAIRSLIAACDTTAAPPTFDPYATGDLSLDANEVAFANPKGDAEHLNDLDVAVQIVSGWDLYNPRFLGYGLARAYRMIYRAIPGNRSHRGHVKGPPESG